MEGVPQNKPTAKCKRLVLVQKSLLLVSFIEFCAMVDNHKIR